MTSKSYDYDFGLICNLACKNFNCIMDKYRFLDELFDIDDYIFDYLCMINEVELDEMETIKKTRKVDDTIDEMSIYCRKICMIDILSRHILIVCININTYLRVSSSNDQIMTPAQV